jgi:hypothetical protein
VEEDRYGQTFDLWLWGTTRVLPLWERFSKSPSSRLLRTSPLVNSAVDRNEYLFFPQGPRPPHPAVINPYERMLAMHVRRGDYKDACVGLGMLLSSDVGFTSNHLGMQRPGTLPFTAGIYWISCQICSFPLRAVLGDGTPQKTLTYTWSIVCPASTP